MVCDHYKFAVFLGRFGVSGRFKSENGGKSGFQFGGNLIGFFDGSMQFGNPRPHLWDSGGFFGNHFVVHNSIKLNKTREATAVSRLGESEALPAVPPLVRSRKK